MTTQFYHTKQYEIERSTFGGIIFRDDFDAHYSMSDMASRILSDWRFDNQCLKDAQAKQQKYDAN